MPTALSLSIESGPPRAHVGPLDAGEYRIGRAPENEIQLIDIAVSRQHARLAVIDGRWCLRDLGSTQGTLLNAARLVPEQDVPLAADDRLRVGPWTFVVRMARAPDEPVRTYYGLRPLHEVLERTAWHVAQHARQIDHIAAVVLALPSAPRLDPRELVGLPVPQQVWDAEVQFVSAQALDSSAGQGGG